MGVSAPAIASIAIKIFKLVLTVIILVLYRTGYGGQFLGVGGTWNLNEDKNADVEILASGVMVGYFIFNLSVLISYCLCQERSATDVIMNALGAFLWVAVAGSALHYWHGYKDEHQFKADTSSERDVGLALGSLCVLTGAAHLIDAVFAWKLYIDKRYD